MLNRIMNPQLSIIIPTLNEQACIKELLCDLKSQVDIKIEIIVSDGGSTDNTVQICKLHNVIISTGAKGRAKQLNFGAKIATYNNLLFLHADTRIHNKSLLADAFNFWKDQTKDTPTAGHFALKFERTNTNNEISFRYTEGKTHFNRVNTTNGDQGCLISKEYFTKLGEYDESQNFLEDQKLAEKIRQTGRWVTLPGTITTSARRFEAEGYHRRYIIMSIIMGLYSTGTTEFFKRAKNIYANQSETGYLQLTPFYKEIYLMHIYDFSIARLFSTWYRLGKYIRENSWQMFYFFDVLLKTSTKTYPFLKFHDKYFWPLTNNFIFNIINAFISFFWFMIALPMYFFIDEVVLPKDTN